MISSRYLPIAIVLTCLFAGCETRSANESSEASVEASFAATDERSVSDSMASEKLASDRLGTDQGGSAPKFEFRPGEKTGQSKQPSEVERNNRERGTDPTSKTAGIKLVEVQEELEVVHTYENGAAGQAMISETIGGGCGWLDYDRDGRPDLFLNQGGSAVDALEYDAIVDDESNMETALRVSKFSNGSTDLPLDGLWRNHLSREDADGAFADVSRHARIVEPHYSQGVAIADFDNDGFDDIYVTNLGRNTLWVNCGDGTFFEAGRYAGVADSQWGVSAGWHDWDRDGDLDLYVTNYCDYDPRVPQECLDREGRPTVCNPSTLSPQPDVAYVNNGDGTFSEQSSVLGLVGEGNRALGVALADFTNDGWPDIYVANDTTDNFLYVNDGTGHFVDEATLRGCAVDRAGGPQGSMGLAIADVDGNGFLDIYSTHYFEESNTLYLNQGDAGFQDQTAISGLHQPTLGFLGFGTTFADVNNDGTFELLVCNGHVDHSLRVSEPRMQPQIFSMTSPRRWTEISGSAGSFFSKKFMARGIASADFDQDGDLDFAICNENDPAVVLRNDSVTNREHWLQLELIGTHSNRSGVGTRVEVTYPIRNAGSPEKSHVQISELVGGSSFASTHQNLLHFGLGDGQGDSKAGELQIGSATVSVVWPSGTQQTLQLPIDQKHRLIEPEMELER